MKLSTALILPLVALLAASCGKEQKSQDHIVVETKPQETQTPAAGSTTGATTGSTTGTPGSQGQPGPGPQPGPQPSVPPAGNAPLAGDPIVGNFEQVDNLQSKIRINQLRIVETNLVIPSPAGDGTRLSPKFPHALIFDSVKGIYTTIGFFNDNTSVFKNVELRLRLYNDNTLLDVTLAVPPDSTLPVPNPNPNPNPNPTFPTNPTQPGMPIPVLCDPRDPCSPICYIFPPTPTPTPVPVPTPIPGTGGGQLLYPYRYQRVTDGTASL